MKTLQNQYIEITEGRGNKDHFLKQARHLFPELITVNSTFKDTVKILKGKSILTEAVGGIATQNPNKPDWFKIFNTNIKEAVGVKDKKEYGDQNTFEKIDKDVAKDLESNFDNSDPKNIDNVYGQSFLMGYLAEMDDPKNANKTVNELKKIVAKNMAQDINYYAKNGMFGVKGIGLETSKESKAPTGKYKSSGYGNLKENKSGVRKSYDQEIDWIKYEVDYVPDKIEVYISWPEPYRSKALKALEYRKNNFKQMSDYKLDTFKESLNTENIQEMNENKLRSIISSIIREELK